MKIKHIFIVAYLMLSLWAAYYAVFVPFVGTFTAGSKYEWEFVIELWAVAINMTNIAILIAFAAKNWNKKIL